MEVLGSPYSWMEMMFTLRRLFLCDDLTTGVLSHDGEILAFTLEPPWKDNQKNLSCIPDAYRDWETDRKSTRLNSSHSAKSRMPSSA